MQAAPIYALRHSTVTGRGFTMELCPRRGTDHLTGLQSLSMLCCSGGPNFTWIVPVTLYTAFYDFRKHPALLRRAVASRQLLVFVIWGTTSLRFFPEVLSTAVPLETSWDLTHHLCDRKPNQGASFIRTAGRKVFLRGWCE
ncbi:hypothetical protein JZ751_029100 [Albula glossodonta]|uniref:Uncharacterized protein n=1 Tax=Albula glossodonta TaxID=121402 RepID=A0A8T2P5K5_9TELE|nr:hypothetical protein JZ751_029100 [Albula glossodonta]